MLEKCLHNRPDLGLPKAITIRILEPRNPFEPESIRRPQRWFVLFLLVSFAFVGAFTYFTFFTFWH